MMKDDESNYYVERLIPEKVWFTLKESCFLKSLNYGSTCNKKYLQPNLGVPDSMIGGVKMWNRNSLLNWVLLSDEQIIKIKNGGN